MSSKLKAALGTYGRALIACALTVVVTSGIDLTSISKADLLKLASSIWAAFVPVIIRALNPNDSGYGITS